MVWLVGVVSGGFWCRTASTKLQCMPNRINRLRLKIMQPGLLLYMNEIWNCFQPHSDGQLYWIVRRLGYSMVGLALLFVVHCSFHCLGLGSCLLSLGSGCPRNWDAH